MNNSEPIRGIRLSASGNLAGSRKASMHHSNNPSAKSGAAGSFSVHPKLFVFFDKKTGTQRFEVKAGDNGSLPADRAASLLAMHCVARGQMPKDFDVMVATDEDLLNGLAGRAIKLIQSCGDDLSPVSLSRRQQEVLRGIEDNLTNKEIGARLNLSERTVKFHVSALLEKFEVRNRASLLLHMANLPSAGMASPLQLPSRKNGPAAQDLQNEARKQRPLDPLERRSGA
jgi:DNA-binding CsgD family transcriptional regulator